MTQARIGAGGPFIVDTSALDGGGIPFFSSLQEAPSPPKRQAGGIEVAASLLLTTLAVAAAPVLRQPLYHQLPVRPVPFEQVLPNLLTSTLAAAPAAPFSFKDWPLLQSRPLLFSDIQRNLLLKVVPFHPALSEGLLPVRGVQQDVTPNLLTDTLAPATAVPFTPVEQAAPLAVRKLFQFDAPNLLLSTLAPTVQAVPFVQLDWPALARAPSVPYYAPANLLTGVLLGQVQPFNQISWPALTATQLTAQPAVGASLALLTTPQPAPFSQLNWPPLPVPVSAQPFLIPNTTLYQVAPTAPPNLRKLYYDVSSGRLFWQVSTTSNPILIEPL